MFAHVTIRVADREASARFYDTVLATLGIERTHAEERVAAWDDFALMAGDDAHPVTRRLHIGFVAPSREHVDRFWRAGTEAGHRDDGAPGPRPEYRDDYYGAFLLDPDGNSAEAVHHDALREPGNIDHVWIRVVDLAGAQRFYESVSPYTGFELRNARTRAWFVGAGSSFTLVPDTPSENVHLAFPARENATVDEFHQVATSAGYRDNGPPGERAVYHPGYYAAYVLDPDGNNIEVVNHNR